MVVVMMIMVVGGLNVGVSGSMEREIDVHAGNVVNTLERIAECTENTTQVDGRDGGARDKQTNRNSCGEEDDHTGTYITGAKH